MGSTSVVCPWWLFSASRPAQLQRQDWWCLSWVPVPGHCWERHGFLYCTTWSPVTCWTTATSIIVHFKPRYLWLSGHLFPITISFCNISVGGKTNRGMGGSLHGGVREGDGENSIWWIWRHYEGPGLALRITAKRIPGKHWEIQLKIVFISGIKGLIFRNEPKKRDWGRSWRATKKLASPMKAEQQLPHLTYLVPCMARAIHRVLYHP